MNRNRSLLLLVMFSLLLCAGCLQEQRPPETPVARHDAMLQHLTNVTTAIQVSLDDLETTVSRAAALLGTTGLTGEDADAVLEIVAGSHPAVTNVITYDTSGTVLSAEPARAKTIIGQNRIDYETVVTTLATEEPGMSDTIPLAEGGDGAVIACPVFSADGTFTGVVSMAFSPYALIRPVMDAEMGLAPSTYMVAQRNGVVLYDPDPGEVGRDTFTDPLFADFPEIIELARQYSGNRTGYATYSFFSAGSGKVVSKETFWDTAGLHGTEWRVLVIGEV